MKKRGASWISSISTWVVPRPKDVLVKAWFFCYGTLVALVLGHALEQRSLWQWAVLVLLYFVLEELCVQQAKIIPDDLRDRARDRTLLHNKGRAIARGALSPGQAFWSMIGRLVFAALFFVWQQRWDLLLVCGVILVHQALYLWAKPRGATHPVLLLLWLSFNNVFRFVAGVVALMGLTLLLPVAGMVVALYFCSVGGLAAQWKMEADTQFCKESAT